MSAMASQITGVSIVYAAFCSGADQRKHQSSALLAFVDRKATASLAPARSGAGVGKLMTRTPLKLIEAEWRIYASVNLTSLV